MRARSATAWTGPVGRAHGHASCYHAATGDVWAHVAPPFNEVCQVSHRLGTLCPPTLPTTMFLSGIPAPAVHHCQRPTLSTCLRPRNLLDLVLKVLLRALHRDQHGVQRVMPHDLRNPVKRSNSIQIVRQPFLQLIEHVMLGHGIDPLVAECLLCLANVTFGELRAHEAPDVVRLDSLNLFR